MSSIKQTLVSALRGFIAALLLLLLACDALQSDIARGQPPRNGPPVYPTNGGNEAPAAPQRFAPDANAARPHAQSSGHPPIDGQRTSYSTPDTQPRPNTATTAPPVKTRSPILLSPRGKATASKASKTEGDGAEERRQVSSAKPNL